MDTTKVREHAQYLLTKAQEALDGGDHEQANKSFEEARAEMVKADSIDEAKANIDTLQADFRQPVNTVPVASKDVESYNPDDTTAKTKADYKPQSWVKGLPSVAQPLWVQEQMGTNLKDQAKFQKDTFTKWMTAPSQEMFFKNATPDEIKAMQEDTDRLILCPLS